MGPEEENREIRLAVDTGKVEIGYNSVANAIQKNIAKAVIIARGSKKHLSDNILHNSSLANVKVIFHEGNSMELGEICGKPYPVSFIAIIDPGASKILEA
ncbi:MAG: 50S ribosomal protein L30e [Candidatus Micrarchaeaceae archaeon]